MGTELRAGLTLIARKGNGQVGARKAGRPWEPLPARCQLPVDCGL
jgi:hypothetical protein